ncbi:MAG: HTTM domain-containing protein, partial [Salibacteraceae bacterium]|nr:HTTM domain-containing protein [Salibacteraceae bacterium]
MEIRRAIHSITSAKVSIAPLVTFRVLFGLIMLASVIRFWLNGWIETQYIEPSFHFKYFGFYWVPEISATGLYIVFFTMAVSALGIALGAFYRVSAVLFFLSFTYVELLDATYYLNHYYFVSLVALLLIFLPANRMHALDVKLGFAKAQNEVAAWAINSIKFQLILVYFLAGLAKLNADWLLNAMPLAIWLPAQDQLPIIGWLMPYKATAVLFSWA